MNKLNNKEIIEDIKKHLTGINQVDIKYLNDQLKKYSKEKNDEVVYEIFTMIYKRLDPEALQKIHSQVESVQAKRIAEFTEAIKLYNNKEYAKSKEILLKLIDLFEKQWNTRTNRTGDQHCQKQGNTDARGYRIGKGEGLSFDCKNIESDQYKGHQSQQTTVA